MRNPNCKQCKLSSTCKTVCTWGRWLDSTHPERGGTSSKNLMIVFDAPDGAADEASNPISTNVDAFLLDFCKKVSIDPARVYVTNMVKCRATGDDIKSREHKACFAYLEEEVIAVRPRIIIVMGEKARKYLVGSDAKHEDRGIGFPFEVSGASIEPHRCMIMPTYDITTLRKQPWLRNEVLTDFQSAWKYTESNPPRKSKYEVNNLPAFLASAFERGLPDAVTCDAETDGEDGVASLDQHLGTPWMLGVSVIHDGGKTRDSFIFDRHSMEMWTSVGECIAALYKQGVPVIAHHGKFDLKWLRHHVLGWDEVRITYDTQLMHHLLNENAWHKLANLEWRYCPERAHKNQNIDLSVQRCHEVDQTELMQYCVEDNISTYIAWYSMLPRILELGLDPLARMLSDVMSVLADTERLGCQVDMDRLNALLADARAKALTFAAYLEEIANAALVSDFNPNSHEQVKHLLYEVFGFDVYRDEDNKISADKDALDALLNEAKHGGHTNLRLGGVAFATYLRQYRTWNYIADTLEGIKTRSVVVDGIPYIRTSYNQNGTVTGRISSSDPNLQNVPTRSEIGRRVKEVFVPGDGFVFVYADYSQAEYRLAAEISGDDVMMKMFESGEDFHEATAQAIRALGSDVERAAAKNINFADLYGAGDRKVAAMSKLPVDTVTVLRGKKRALFGKLTRWIESVPRNAIGNGGRVHGIFGRVRRVPYASSPIKWWSSRAARQLVNSPVQGSASDLMMHAILRVQRDIIDEHQMWDDARLVLTVHDSAMWRVRTEKAEQFGKDVKYVMEHPNMAYFGKQPLRVPIVADVEIFTDNWGDKHCKLDGEEGEDSNG